jgi:hypothetical protein
MNSEAIIIGALAGIAATATMDVFAIASAKVGLTAGAKGEWVGRWYLGMTRGRFAHSDITLSPEQAGEKQAALFGHYAIGIVLALFYVVAAGWLDVPPDSLFVALGYGFATTVFPWLLVLPALGFGAFGLQGPPGLKLFRTSLLNRTSHSQVLTFVGSGPAFLPFVRKQDLTPQFVLRGSELEYES